MKISRVFREIKALSLLLGILGACAAPVAQAPFPGRPDTTEPGDLTGPFEGQVKDAATGRPVAGATVQASWGFEIGRGLTGPAASASRATDTDADGRYRIPRLAALQGGRTRLTRFTLIVYKPGYVAYRSDRRFDDFGIRHDFAQTRNEVKLEPFLTGMSHVKHVRFAGGGGTIRRAMAGEYVQASLELAGAPAEPPKETGPLFDASGLLSADELKAATGFAGDFQLERLGDLPQSTSYDSKHFRATGKPESFDAAIRVWRPATVEEAERAYAKLQKEVPHAESKDELGDASLRGYDGRILGVAAIDKEHRVVIELTCGVDLCRDADQAVGLARRVLSRAIRPPGQEPPIEEKQEEPKKEGPAPPPAPPEQEKPFQLRQPGLRR
jgi:hypothetical protein